MNIVGIYSFNGGSDYIRQHYAHLLQEVEQIVLQVDAEQYKTKISQEKTMAERILYSPKALNRAFSQQFTAAGWRAGVRIPCDYPSAYYVDGYQPPQPASGAYRAMDFVKATLGVKVQFGKYAFMVYNVCARMTIFRKQGFITAGIEIVPVKEVASAMSTGVSYFEQFVWDLEQRSVADIDIPVMILGIK